MPGNNEYAKLSGASYFDGTTPVAPVGYQVIGVSPLNNNGFQAVAFQNVVSREIVISFEGTNGLTYSQLMADVGVLNGLAPQAIVDGINYTNSIAETNPGDPISVTGHSLVDEI